ncbi:ABC transporter permease [Embleya hyalina]|uniref:ABC transporter permease n=1 Tax=Embleya hyalina TaxID=516124 RepID=A0A401YJE0_9ACTN|nr:ABC transporter permease [Embleya hyalina]
MPAVASVTGPAMFLWPLLASPAPGSAAHSGDAPLIFAVLPPFVVAVVPAEPTGGGLDSKAPAMPAYCPRSTRHCGRWAPHGGDRDGVLHARPGRAGFGPGFGFGFGFLLGCTSLFVSALLTAGVGPAFVPGDAVLDNLCRFSVFAVLTSGHRMGDHQLCRDRAGQASAATVTGGPKRTGTPGE